jgi:hypothetical protein
MGDALEQATNAGKRRSPIVQHRRCEGTADLEEVCPNVLRNAVQVHKGQKIDGFEFAVDGRRAA